jgi:hypothetical protein
MADPLVVGAAQVAIPARKNPVVWVRAVGGVIFVAVAWRKRGWWWVLGVLGVLGLLHDVPALVQNRPTTKSGQ